MSSSFYAPASDGLISSYLPNQETSIYYLTLIAAYYGANKVQAWANDRWGLDSKEGWLGMAEKFLAGGGSMLALAMIMHYLVYQVVYKS